MVDFMTDSRRQTFRDVFVDFSVELQRLEESTPEAILSEDDGLLQCFTAVCDNMCVLDGSYAVGMRPLTDPRRLVGSGSSIHRRAPLGEELDKEEYEAWSLESNTWSLLRALYRCV